MTELAIKTDIQDVKETVIRIEADHGQKLGALFDGYKLNAEKLDRIEEKQQAQDENLETIERVVTKHDVVIKTVK